MHGIVERAAWQSHAWQTELKEYFVQIPSRTRTPYSYCVGPRLESLTIGSLNLFMVWTEYVMVGAFRSRAAAEPGAGCASTPPALRTAISTIRDPQRPGLAESSGDSSSIVAACANTSSAPMGSTYPVQIHEQITLLLNAYSGKHAGGECRLGLPLPLFPWLRPPS